MPKHSIPEPIPATKVCSICHEEKPLEAFSPHPQHKYGRHAQCKACMARKRRERRLLHGEEVRRQGREFYRQHHSRSKTEVAEKPTKKSEKQSQIREQPHEWKRKWKDTEYVRAYNRSYRKYHKVEFAAREIVRKRIEAGSMSPASDQLCFVCGVGRWEKPDVIMVYHHTDYARPLEVFPLCKACHNRWHAADKGADPELRIVKEEYRLYEYDSLDELYDQPGFCEGRERTL